MVSLSNHHLAEKPFDKLRVSGGDANSPASLIILLPHGEQQSGDAFYVLYLTALN